MDEIKRLSNSFGIGLIKLDVNNPDFRDFLKRVKIDLTSKEIRKEKYDKIIDIEEMIKKLK